MIDRERMIGRVVKLRSQRAEIYTGDGYLTAIVKGKVKYGSRKVSPIAVGDYVRYTHDKGKSAAVEYIESRRSVLSKPVVEKEAMTQVVAANIDRLVIVTSLKNPRFKPGLVDRFLVVAFKENLSPVIVLNKIDLGDPQNVQSYFDAWRSIFCTVVYTSALNGEGIEELKGIMQNGTSVVSGHSGVGKSSLLNVMAPELNLKTGMVSSSTDRGIHTTSGVSLYRIFDDGWVADTPGLKVFGLAGISRKNLHQFFPEFGRMESACRFKDCVHVDEPDCAIKKSADDEHGEIASFRYESYYKIFSELT